jgi:hypothetical protein
MSTIFGGGLGTLPHAVRNGLATRSKHRTHVGRAAENKPLKIRDFLIGPIVRQIDRPVNLPDVRSSACDRARPQRRIHPRQLAE